ncbi:MAG: hypothetical protein M0006_03380 [Magnetospirillum sp.]|nr:hypothetical protein [Magnetospirillum sp.]
MDMIAFLTLVIRLVPLAVAAGEDIAAFIERWLAVAQRGGDPTADDWAHLHTLEAKLTAKLDAAASEVSAIAEANG